MFPGKEFCVSPKIFFRDKNASGGRGQSGRETRRSGWSCLSESPSSWGSFSLSLLSLPLPLLLPLLLSLPLPLPLPLPLLLPLLVRARTWTRTGALTWGRGERGEKCEPSGA